MHAIAHGGVQTHIRESALKVDSGRKIPCRTGESNLHQQHDSLMLSNQLGYTPTCDTPVTLKQSQDHQTGYELVNPKQN